LKTLTAQWSWYRRGCGYCSSILDFLELYLRRDLEHNVVAPQPAVPESRGWKSSSHSRDGTATILLSKFAKMWCTMLGDEYFSRVYHDEFLAWYAQREGNDGFAGGFICIITPVARLIFETKNRAIFLERFFGRRISGAALLPYNFVPITWLWSGFIFPELEHL